MHHVNIRKMQAAIALLGALAFGQALAADRSSDESAIRELKGTLWPRAYFEQDTALLDRILAPELLMSRNTSPRTC